MVKTGKKHINKSKWNTEKSSFVNSEKSIRRTKGINRGKITTNKEEKRTGEWNTKSK